MPKLTPPRAAPPTAGLHTTTLHTATLHIGALETVVLIRQAGQPDSTITLAIGAQAVPATLFRHDPPTPGEIENAIMVVEDEVMPALARMVPAFAATLLILREVMHHLKFATLMIEDGVGTMADRLPKVF